MRKMLVEVSSLDIAWQEMQNRCRHKHLCSLDNKDGERVCVCVCARRLRQGSVSHRISWNIK